MTGTADELPGRNVATAPSDCDAQDHPNATLARGCRACRRVLRGRAVSVLALAFAAAGVGDLWWAAAFGTVGDAFAGLVDVGGGGRLYLECRGAGWSARPSPHPT